MVTKIKNGQTVSSTPFSRFLHFFRDHPIAFWSCLFLLLRIFFLFANDGLIFEAGREDITNGQILFKEEFNNSTPARELLRGNDRMLWGLAFCGYGVTGGEFYQMLLLTGVIGLLGDSYYAVKALPIAFTFFTFFFLLITIQRYFGNRAAHLFGPIYTLGFPFFLLPSFNGMGNHQEVALFISLGFMTLSYLLFDERRTHTMPAFLLLGLSTGFGFFYNTLSASFLIWLAPVGLVAFFQTWKLLKFRKACIGALLFLVGISIGFSPYLAVRKLLIVPMNIDLTLKRDMAHFEGIGMPGYEKYPLKPEMTFLQTFSKVQFSKKGFKLLFGKAPFNMYFVQNKLLNSLYAGLLLILFIVFFFLLVHRNGPGRQRFLILVSLLLILIHMLIVSASIQSLDYITPNVILGYRYLMPVMPFLLFWMIGVLSMLFDREGKSKYVLANLIFIALLVLGFIGYQKHLAPSRFLDYRALDGFSYQVLAIGAGDYFREYPAPVSVQCDQIRLYLSNCDPAFKEQIDRAVAKVCENQGYKMKNF